MADETKGTVEDEYIEDRAGLPLEVEQPGFRRSPSDVAHDIIKGDHVYPGADTESTAVARAAAFDLTHAQPDSVNLDEDELRQRNDKLDEVRDQFHQDNDGPTDLADHSGDDEAAFTKGDEADVQDREMASAEENYRREAFSASELEEAEVRDSIVEDSGDTVGDGEGHIPNVGAPAEAVAADDEGRPAEDEDTSDDESKE